MSEPTGQVTAEPSGAEATMQAAYSKFIVHTQKCAACRTKGVDCIEAAELRSAYRAAKPKVHR